MDAYWLAVSLLLYILLTLLKSLQYYYLIGKRVGYAEVMNIVVIQNATSNFVATSAGIASYLALFRVEQGVKLTRATMVFLLTKVGDLISVWLFLFGSGLLMWRQVAFLHNLIILLLAVIGGALLVFFLAVLVRQKLVRLLRSFLEWTRLSRIQLLTQGIDILQSLAEQEHRFVFRMLGIGVLFSFLYMIITMTWIYSSLRVFSFDIGILPVVFVNSMLQLFSYLPIQVFGGLGITESAALYFYGFLQFPQVQLAGVLIGTRLLFYLTNLVVLLYLPLYRLILNPTRGGISAGKI